MHKERSGSLGATPKPFLQPIRFNPSSDEQMSTDAEGYLEDFAPNSKLIKDLRIKTRQQAQQIMAWRRAYKIQELFITRLQREKCDQLKAISSKLLLFESRLIRKQKDIAIMLNVRENLIFKQQRVIENLTNRLTDNGLEVPQNEITDMEYSFPDLESLNDSDSAVVLEDPDYENSYHILSKFRNLSSDHNNGITVMRSISDAIDPNLKYTSRRNNGFLRRPEILETVYSVEEDADNENNKDELLISDVTKRRESFAMRGKSDFNVDSSHEENPNCSKKSMDRDKNLNNDENKMPDDKNEEKSASSNNTTSTNNNNNPVKTYNRVMSNHRSVTKPKDVKYKRINKAKSKSLEELRGKLKNWVEQGSKIPSTISLEHTQSYA